MTQSQTLSPGIQSKIKIDNVGRVVHIPFDTIRLWSNHFIKYDFLNKENKYLNNFLDKKFYNDSLVNTSQNNLIDTYKNIIKNDSTQKDILFKELKRVELKNDTLFTKNIILDTKVKIYQEKYTPWRDIKLVIFPSLITFILTKVL